jgi:hypothetical protein
MIKKVIYLIILTFFNIGTVKSQFSFIAGTKYGYNQTYGHYGSFAVFAKYKPLKYFEIGIGFQGSTANVYALPISANTIFNLPKGYLQLEKRYIYRAFVRNKNNEHSGGIALAYFHNYINVSFGVFGRLTTQMGKSDIGDQQRYLIEPLDFMYRIEGSIRKMDSKWNLSLRLSNYDAFQLERWQSPMVTLIGKYDFNQELTIWANFGIKPQGVFHIAANFYEVFTNVGVVWNVQMKNKE